MKTILSSILAKVVIYVSFLLVFSLGAVAQEKYELKVVVKGIKERSGTIGAILTNDATNFPSGVNAIDRKVITVTPEGDIVLTFSDILEGRYAVILLQDLNGNQVLDMNGQMPTEPFGFSNLTFLMGPPAFDQCAFQLDENKTIEIQLMVF